MGYIPGRFFRICDICGLKRYNTEMKKTWDNLWVCSDTCFDGPRNPQDYLVKPFADRITVNDPRPEPTETYITDLLRLLYEDGVIMINQDESGNIIQE